MGYSGKAGLSWDIICCGAQRCGAQHEPDRRLNHEKASGYWACGLVQTGLLRLFRRRRQRPGCLDDIAGIADFILEKTMVKTMKDFTHFNEEGHAKMVDVGEKDVSRRTAVAAARVLVNRETFDLIRSGGMKKGDVLTVAQIAGIMGAKRTPDLIPMCHPVMLDGIDLSLKLDEACCSVEIEAAVSCTGRTGVEMKALTAASTAALTVYDMCKAVQKDIVISDLRLLRKTGGVHGDFQREDD